MPVVSGSGSSFERIRRQIEDVRANLSPSSSSWGNRNHGNSSRIPSGRLFPSRGSTPGFRSGGYRPGHRYRNRYGRGNRLPIWGSDYWWKHNPATRPGYHGHDTDDNSPDVPVVVDEGIQKCVDIDYNKAANRTAHHTDDYNANKLIIRRGQTFRLTLKLTQPFDKAQHTLLLQFTKGDEPKQNKGTLIKLKSSTKLSQDDWAFTIGKVSGKEVPITVQTSSEALVGEYKLFVETVTRGEGDRDKHYRHQQQETVVLLFNPWQKGDSCYVAGDAERQEYVLNETGRIWVGSSRSNRGRPWNYGQFEEDCLDAALYLLDQSSLSDQSHGNPVPVSRALSAMVNSNDDNGVLSGNWSGNYVGGTAPSKWNGTPAIMKEYMRYKRAVKYGQCWVFSGVLTTVCRSLGIPCRSVTNFESAHDTDASMTIDSHISILGQPLPQLDDSTWNFHVWNEVYMQRPDLPDGMDGWQAIDATPQETSEGQFRCGPSPLAAIKEGMVYLGFDTKFIYGEVNGDKLKWVQERDGTLRPIGGDIHCVGKSISTKAVGDTVERLDLTHDYKYPEGSTEEREAMKRASKHSSRRAQLDDVYKTEERQDVKIVPYYNVDGKGDIAVKVVIQNKSAEVRTLDMRFDATAVYYTGVPGETVNNHKAAVTVQPNKEGTAEWTILGRDYLNDIDEDAKVRVYVCAHVQQTDQFYTDMQSFEIEKPDVQIEVPMRDVKVGEDVEVTLKVINPLEVALNDAEFRVEGPGLQEQMVINIGSQIYPNETVSRTIKLKPRYAGKRHVIACFNCRQLTNITGETTINVLK